MSVGQLPPPRAPRAPHDAKLVQYIDQQIHATRRAVKTVDWATSLVVLAAGVTAFLLTAAVVEHWLVPGGFSVPVRSALFLCLVGALCYYAVRRLWPLCRSAINPVFAAHTIERSSPTLKNSLVNLLLFRQNRSQISEAVYHTLEEQAAQGLTRVPIEAAVDRSLLIRVGYVLLAVVALGGLYKVLSPKDPLVAAQRVLLPWSDIVPASRVSIRAVTPGTVTLARGEFLDVSAEIHDLGKNDAVLLRYTTADGQAVDRPVEMRQAKDALRFEGRLPDNAGNSEKLGVAQNLRYRIEAGDARSLDFDVTVVPAPSILVDRVEYNYPDYTGFVDRTVEGLGDIRAIEGTRVTIHARANGPIKDANVDFNADGRRDVKMSADGTNATATFELALREDRQTPRHASYVLVFTNADGRPNREPVKYPIAVEPDLLPEAAILRPQEKLLDVQLDDTVTIEVEARDPDFALSTVRLRGEVAGRAVMDEQLLAAKPPRGYPGRFTARHQFAPKGHDLRPGDIIEYWVMASDNRTPTANAAESERKRLRIASPNRAQQPPPDRIARNDRRQQNQQRQDQQRQDGESGTAQGNEFSRDPKGSAEQGTPDQETGRQGDTPNQNSQDAKNDANQRPNDNQSGRQEEGGEQGQSGQEAKPGEQNSNGSQNSNGKQQHSNGEQTGAGAAGGEASEQDSQPRGTRPDGNAQPRPGTGQSQSPTPDTPVSAEGDNDAEAFSRIRQHLKRTGDLKENDSKPPDTNEFSREPQASAEPGEKDKETKRQEDNQPVDGEPASAGTEQDATNKAQHDSVSQNAQPNSSASPEQSQGARQKKQPGQDAQHPGARAQDQGEGPGAETRPNDLPDNKTQLPNSEGGEQDKSPGGQQTSSKGPSGAGNQQQSQGAPNSQPEMKPAQKHQQSGSGEQTDKQEPSAGARGRRESDSHGEEGGDKAGGGEEGGGQKSPRDGTGSAGQNQSADEGAGESSEKGTGNTSPNAGQDTKADRQTGQSSGETTGRGSKTRESQDTNSDPATNSPFSRDPKGSAEPGPPDKETTRQGGEQDSPAEEKPGGATSSSDKPPEGEPASASGEQPEGEAPPARGGEKNETQHGSTPTGDGGQQGTGAPQSASSQGEAPPADAANLGYAREQTDLVLDKLANQLQRDQVDEGLLDKLGWSEDDLRRFVERWQQLKDAAKKTDPAGDAANRELDDALRSLGLRRGQLQQGPVRDDTQRDLRQGYRGPVPPKFQERLRIYNQGISRAKSGE